jgi:predicted murein hydrolase (TIGR00659 family)
MTQIFTSLTQEPLLWLTLTLGIYLAFQWVFNRCNHLPLLNPVLWTIVALSLLLWLTEVPYETYFSGAKVIHFLLGPATVALAVPLYHQFEQVRDSAKALTFVLIFGCVLAIVIAVFAAAGFDASHSTLISLSPKSVTTPIAMGVSEGLGGAPSLTAVFVILTGIVGAVFTAFIMKWGKIHDHRAMGFALGLAAHGLGTARAFQISQTAGAFAGIAIGLNGLMTAFILPILLPVLLSILE